GQQGLCYVTQQELEIGNMECHHKKPKSLGGNDEYKNLVWLCYEAHKLVHSTEQGTISKYQKILKDEKGLKRLNTLRKLVGNSVI
ncbi:HNH endonuclease, partial [Clostridium sp. cpc1]